MEKSSSTDSEAYKRSVIMETITTTTNQGWKMALKKLGFLGF